MLNDDQMLNQFSMRKVILEHLHYSHLSLNRTRCGVHAFSSNFQKIIFHFWCWSNLCLPPSAKEKNITHNWQHSNLLNDALRGERKVQWAPKNFGCFRAYRLHSFTKLLSRTMISYPFSTKFKYIGYCSAAITRKPKCFIGYIDSFQNWPYEG